MRITIMFLFIVGFIQAQTNIEFGGGLQYKMAINSLQEQEFYNGFIFVSKELDRFRGGLFATSETIGVRCDFRFGDWEYESLYTTVGLDFHYQIRNYEFTDTYNGIGVVENTPLLLTPYIQQTFRLFEWSSLFARLRIVGLKMATFEVGLLFIIKKN